MKKYRSEKNKNKKFYDNYWKYIELEFQKHIDLVDEKGFIIIETPNFNGFMQRIPRKFFDRENYLRHNIYSMNLKKWEKLLRDNNFEIMLEILLFAPLSKTTSILYMLTRTAYIVVLQRKILRVLKYTRLIFVVGN